MQGTLGCPYFQKPSDCLLKLACLPPRVHELWWGPILILNAFLMTSTKKLPHSALSLNCATCGMREVVKRSSLISLGMFKCNNETQKEDFPHTCNPK